VIGGDVAIAAAAVYGVLRSGSGQNATQIVAILTSAFTAIGTMTTAYFGIRAASNTAQAAVSESYGGPSQPEGGGPSQPEGGGPSQPEGGGTATVDKATGGAAETTGDRPTEEPEGATQQEQYDLLRETGNERRDMTEEEEAAHLEAEFGPPGAAGLYGAPEGEELGAPEGEELGAPEGEELGAPEGEELGAPEGEEKL
jgi:hypothetical protein